MMTGSASATLPPFFTYRNGQLYLEEVALAEIATRYSTPAYVYSANAMRQNFERYVSAFQQADLDLTICYAVKANSNLSVLRLFREMGGGADVVSGGELYRALQAGIDPQKISFAGVGKTTQEIDYALAQNIGVINVESAAELALIERRAIALGRVARIGLRVNPDVDAHTHPYITTGTHFTKFGSSPAHTLVLARQAAQSSALHLVGLQAHIGSQLLEVGPLVEAFARLLDLARQLEAENIGLEHLGIGGGLGVTYQDERPEPPAKLASALAARMEQRGVRHKYRLLAEPGRYLVANTGALLTEVLYLKQEGPDAPCFAVVDAGMNDLIRPALYSARHRIVPLNTAPAQAEASLPEYEIVGPVCESADFFAHAAALPALVVGDKLALLGAGAYGFSMASNYNSRPRPPEILVEGAAFHQIRRRETYADLIAFEE